jgi:CheY-like chemotaxis protein
MGGHAAAATIRAAELREGRHRVPIIALSAGVEPEEVQECYRAGMTDFVPKPAPRAQLYAALLRAIAK